MTKFKEYMVALRPWSFSASFTPVLLGSALAYNDLSYHNDVNFSYIIFILCSLIALCVHGAANLVNTYFDFKKGVDLKNTCSDRTLVDKILQPEDVTKFGVILYTFGSVMFMILLYLTTPSTEFILIVLYFGGLSLSFLYTGGIGFKYMALGDLIIIITFGPITVLFAYLAQIGNLIDYQKTTIQLIWLIKPLLYAIPLAVNTECILHSNNARDSAPDKKAGIVTVAIILGYTGSYILYVLLLFIPYFVFIVMAIKLSVWFMLPIVTIPIAFSLEKEFRFNKLLDLPINTAKLNLAFGLLYVIACLFAN
jgi:1,4-dihydroxy-2-naphthoate octaprenyltransferase